MTYNKQSSEGQNVFYLPNYMTSNGYNKEFFEYVDNYDTLIKYFNKKNEYGDLTFDEDFLKDFYHNFAAMILELSVYTPVENIDFIYKQVLNYFSSYQTDEVLIGMSLIFNSMYSVAEQNSINCGCNINSLGNNTNIVNCTDIYKNAMIEYSKTLFGDYTFYQKWFFINDDVSGLTQVNQTLVDKLRLFITEFLSLELNINTNVTSSQNCMCPSIDTTNDECNRGILRNFLTILDFVESNTIEENSNRIKVYGNEFGNIFPKLIF